MPKVDVKITDKSDEVLKAKETQIELALQAIGAEAATYAQKDAPVDSGRLKNSIAWATTKSTGGSLGAPAKASDSTPNGVPEEDSVYIGTNVEYAARQEYGDFNHKVGKKHFLKDAATGHSEHYKKIVEAALKA